MISFPEASRVVSGVLARFEIGAAAILLIAIVVIAPYANMQARGLAGALLLLFAGLGLAWVLIACHPIDRFVLHFVANPMPSPVFVALAGLCAQVLSGILTAPVPVSDMKTYLDLAERLASGQSYVTSGGQLAFWPPGLPLFLCPFVFMFGATLTAVIVANAVLFLIAAWAIWCLSVALFSRNVGVLALILYCIWPSRLLSAGLASKENLTVTLMVLGMAMMLKAVQPDSRGRVAQSVAGGCAFGLASLAQPGLMLLGATLPVMFRGWLAPLRPRNVLAILALGVVGYLAVTVPWQVRNCIVFEGKFCGIATNGGSVAYRANNPLASGLWTEQGSIPIVHLPELEQNEVGFRMAKEWILANPSDFTGLALRKLRYLLGSDDQGAYWGVLRGDGEINEARMQENLSDVRRTWFTILQVVSLIFWVIVAALSVRACHRLWNERREGLDRYVLLVYPLLYCAAVFAVFESGARQHMVAVGPLLVLAAFGIRDVTEKHMGGAAHGRKAPTGDKSTT